MNMNSRNQACARAATALRDAVRAMEAALGAREAQDLAQDLNLDELTAALDDGVLEQVAREALYDAWQIMDETLGYEASSDLAEQELVKILQALEQQEFQGVAE